MKRFKQRLYDLLLAHLLIRSYLFKKRWIMAVLFNYKALNLSKIHNKGLISDAHSR